MPIVSLSKYTVPVLLPIEHKSEISARHFFRVTASFKRGIFVAKLLEGLSFQWSNYVYACPLGWSDFEENATFSMLCQLVVGPQFQNFMS